MRTLKALGKSALVGLLFYIFSTCSVDDTFSEMIALVDAAGLFIGTGLAAMTFWVLKDENG